MNNLALANSLLKSYQSFTGSHFIFNAINTIQSDLLLNRDKEAFETLQIFNRLYKYAVRCSNEQITLLEDEIQFLNQYLIMEHIRFNGNCFAKSVSSGPIKSKTIIPTFIFQSFIENAILLSLDQSPDSKLGINVSQEGDNITLQLTMATNQTVRYHSKIEQKTRLAEQRLVKLAKASVCTYNLQWNEESFMQLEIKCIDH